jgi:hypothetical protein
LKSKQKQDKCTHEEQVDLMMFGSAVEAEHGDQQQENAYSDDTTNDRQTGDDARALHIAAYTNQNHSHHLRIRTTLVRKDKKEIDALTM